MPIFPVEPVEGVSSLTVEDVKTHLGITGSQNDDELESLLLAAVKVVEGMVGPLDVRSFTETHAYRWGQPIILRRVPVVALTGVTVGGSDVDLDTLTVDTSTGILSGHYGDATVTYTAGRSSLPSNIRYAILRWIAWSWARAHGGSETFEPGGATFAGLGVASMNAELRSILADDLLGPVIA